MKNLPFNLGASIITVAKPMDDSQKFWCFPMMVDESEGKDCLLCKIATGRPGSGWDEWWNLEHTLVGINQGFYKLENIKDIRENLKDCPFCNSGYTSLHPNGLSECGSEHGIPDIDTFYVHCDQCGADGPQADDELISILLWSKR